MESLSHLIHIHRVYEITYGRYTKLVEKKANQGVNTPTFILTEIEACERELNQYVSTLKANLQPLKESKALMGISSPPELDTLIEDIEAVGNWKITPTPPICRFVFSAWRGIIADSLVPGTNYFYKKEYKEPVTKMWQILFDINSAGYQVTIDPMRDGIINIYIDTCYFGQQ